MSATSVAKEDILHPLATCQQIYNGNFTVFEGARVFHVTPLNDGSTDAPRTALYRAITATGLPKIGDLYPGKPGQAGCFCTNIRPLPIQESDNDAYVIATYSTPLPSGPTTQATIVAFERDTVLATELAQLHPKDFSPLTYQLPYPAKADQQIRPANIPYQVKLKRITITAAVRAANVDALENAAGSVNDATWQKFPKGFWLFHRFTEKTTNQFPVIELLELEFLCRVHRNWLEYDWGRNDMLGTRLTIDPKVLAAALSAPYIYGTYDPKKTPGIVVAGLYPMVSFKQLLGIN